jgi:inhibitor of cysteine peptidase
MPDVERSDHDDQAMERDRYEARVGESVFVRLPENASTGYVWSMVSLGDGLELVEDRVHPALPASSEAGPAPGAANERVFHLRPTAPGSWPVELRLARSWESTSQQERRLTISVT